MQLLSLFKYLATVILTGESGNIWLYTLDESIIDSVYDVGQYISVLLFPVGG